MAAGEPDSKTPIALSQETFARHAAAVEYVEQIVQTRAPRDGRQRFPGLAPGAWGKLASGATITAASGITLGTGSVKLCDVTGTVYPEDETVTVYNPGAAITASGSGKIVRLAWTLGDWCVNCAAS